jgi:hypothetical protein
LTDSSKKYDLLDLDRDLPTTKEDVEKLWELSRRLVYTSPKDANRLRDPYWTMEKAMAAPLFTDDDEPFEL